MITAKQDAARRTKNRINEHTIVLVSTVVSHNIPNTNDKACSLFRCTVDDCGWVGWLPLDELEEI